MSRYRGDEKYIIKEIRQYSRFPTRKCLCSDLRIEMIIFRVVLIRLLLIDLFGYRSMTKTLFDEVRMDLQ